MISGKETEEERGWDTHQLLHIPTHCISAHPSKCSHRIMHICISHTHLHTQALQSQYASVPLHTCISTTIPPHTHLQAIHAWYSHTTQTTYPHTYTQTQSHVLALLKTMEQVDNQRWIQSQSYVPAPPRPGAFTPVNQVLFKTLSSLHSKVHLVEI